MITSCEFAITKIMAEITPIGSIDSHDISNPPHLFLLQLGRRRRRKPNPTTQNNENHNNNYNKRERRERERERERELPI